VLDELSVPMQGYLETVYECSEGELGARVSDIAARLNVSKASVSDAMTVLARHGMVESSPYSRIHLTDQGLRLAEMISLRHNAIENLFTKVLGVRPSVAYADACAIEHIISQESVEKISSYLKQLGLDK